MNNNGLVKFLGKMPCRPNEIKICPYVLPEMFNKAETEEAAARILAYSQKEDDWVGVSWCKLIEDMREELRFANEVTASKNAALQKCQNDLAEYNRLKTMTMGIYSLFAKKPTISDYEEEGLDIAISNMPYSLIGVMGIHPVLSGLETLATSRLIRVGLTGISKDVYFPSPELVSIIMKKQALITK
jgi:hypothetical protein